MKRYSDTVQNKALTIKEWSFAYWFIAPFLVTAAGTLFYMYATGQLDLWRFGIAS